MNIPPMADYIVDHAGVLSASDLQSLNQEAKSLETTTSAQIAALLIPSRWDYQMLDIGLKVFRDTGLGQKDKNNWLLLVISTEEKKIRIVVWYWLEGDIPDVVASDIIEKSVRPLVNSGDYVWAIQAYYARVNEIITNPAIAESIKSQANLNNAPIDVKGSTSLLFFMFFVALGAGGIFNKKDKGSRSLKIFRVLFSFVFLAICIRQLQFIISIVTYIVAFIVGMFVKPTWGWGFGGWWFWWWDFGWWGWFSGWGWSSGGGWAGD